VSVAPEPPAGSRDAAPDRPRAPQAVAERVHGAPPARVEYVGFVTRSLALALDAAVIDLVAAVVGGIVALVFALLRLGEDLRTVALAIGGVAFVLWSVGYFVAFWSTTGQTPGNRVLGIRVRCAEPSDQLRPRRALLRFVMLTLAALPLGAGFLPVLFDARRRGVHDMVARTVVVVAVG
jgi:uncharacterized RDD family membrane protein YckC